MLAVLVVRKKTAGELVAGRRKELVQGVQQQSKCSLVVDIRPLAVAFVV